jgi:hypothetical protein
MKKRVFAMRFGGWILAELLCCFVIAISMVACIMQSTDAMLVMGRRLYAREVNAEGYLSLVSEISSGVTSCALQHGSWSANIDRGAAGPDGYVANVVLERPDGDSSLTVEWKLWQIAGRR